MSTIGKERWGILAALALSQLLVVLDGTVFGLAIPTITQELRPSSAELLLMNDVYPLVLAGLLLTAGATGDRFGRKKILLVGFVVFGSMSAFASVASTPGQLIAARIGTAVGGAMILPSVLSITRIVFPDRKERTMALAIIGSVLTVGAAGGPVLGGFLLEHFHWGWIFLINVPVILLAGAVVVRMLPESRNPDAARLDLIGAVLSILGIGALVFGIKKAITAGLDVTTVVGLVLGIGLLTGFVLWLRRAPHPLLDLNLFRSRGFSIGVGAAGAVMLVMSGTMFVLEQQFQAVLHYSPMKAGFALLPLLVSIIAGSLVGYLFLRAGHRLTLGIGLGLTAVSLFAVWPALTAGSYLPIAAVLIGVGLGIGMTMIASNDAVISTAPATQAGTAAATEETTYELGIGLGVSTMGGMAFSLYAGSLQNVPGISEQSMNAARESASAAVAEAAQLPPELATRLLAESGAAFTGAIQSTALVGAAVAAVIAVVVWFLMPKHVIAAEDAAKSVH